MGPDDIRNSASSDPPDFDGDLFEELQWESSRRDRVSAQGKTVPIEGVLEGLFQSAAGGADAAADEGPPSQLNVAFTLGGSGCAFPAEYALEVGQIPKITPVPNVPDWLAGVANRRGDILSVVDLRAFLELNKANRSAEGQLIVARARNEDLNIGFIVDKVNGVTHLYPDRLAGPKIALYGRLTQFVSGVFSEGGRSLLALDIQKLLQSPELRQFEAHQ
ncbi:MAG TPA: chemotaxis protein CheW [Blastocatellia bacterium]|nr:chemotaxis protein CheW [Blastocatellia bacterium]